MHATPLPVLQSVAGGQLRLVKRLRYRQAWPLPICLAQQKVNVGKRPQEGRVTSSIFRGANKDATECGLACPMSAEEFASVASALAKAGLLGAARLDQAEPLPLVEVLVAP